MWAMTTLGFFSATCARQGSGGKGQPVDPDRIMIRARLREHLENLQAFALTSARLADAEDPPALLLEVSEADIHESQTTDYRCRIFVSKAAWADVLARLALAEDYDNFKSAVYARMGACPYEEALHRVWSVMYGIQEARTGPGIYSAPSKDVGPALMIGDRDDDTDVLVIVDKLSKKNRRVCGYVVRPSDFGDDDDAYAQFIDEFPEKSARGRVVYRHTTFGEIKHLRGQKGVAIY